MAKLIYTAFGNRVIGPAIADWLSSSCFARIGDW